MQKYLNSIKLHGVVTDAGKIAINANDRECQKFMISVNRLSGAKDILPVEVPLDKLTEPLKAGDEITVNGLIKVDVLYLDNEKSKLEIYVKALRIAKEECEDCNEVILFGRVSKTPILRETPLGKVVCDTMLVTTYKTERPIPIIFWGGLAKIVSELHLRDHMRVFGRLQSREYTKETENGPETRVFYEVSALKASTYPRNREKQNKTEIA